MGEVIPRPVPGPPPILVLQGFLAATGAADLQQRLALEEARELCFEPESEAARIVEGDAVLEVSLSAPPPRELPQPDGSVLVLFEEAGKRYRLRPEPRGWRIDAIEGACQACATEGCKDCGGLGWFDPFADEAE